MINMLAKFFPYLLILAPLFSSTGYVRLSETSFCMDNCSIYYLESETGDFITWITHLDDLDMLLDYQDRFVTIEGDTVSCVECAAIDVDSIELSYDCLYPVYCFADPCGVSNCPSYPEAECVSNFCGGCWADYYVDGEWIPCNSTPDCVDLTGIDFGDCDMPIGIGFVNNSCVSISGCSWVIDSVDYSNAFFETMADCEAVCSSVSSESSNHPPIRIQLVQNYPNPFNPRTSINFSIETFHPTSLRIFDLSGRLVKTLLDRSLSPGNYEIDWDATNNTGQKVSGGIYYYTLEVGDFKETRKMVLLK